ncbi:putative Diacylglycerol kinase [Aurantimonas manganoxydans SI85-9A1]|uniref:Diacylglycerol kinase n=1 Tax=Aurantimonas manganoxydans (strain ATCC BAA-1229 / DSM 21871 / SI85-9A1) TaxID=287752 RepID=Q1YL15_AURMS|nr:diacylglycerol kinase [Aurantimonas manganoxydans]EAS50956.1 putative Diacylglycerol kinase [Aurantimonas manganoxydans SI85-9A1]
MSRTRSVPGPAPKKRGLDHVVAATGYSIGGLRVLWRQEAFRHELLVAFVVFLLHALTGVSALAILAQAICFTILFAAEAINTAIEHIVDHLSPEWSTFARETKDLGSAAVFVLLLANGGLAVGVWLRVLELL